MKIILPDFANKSELYDYLIENKKDLVNLKKSAIKQADCFGLSKFEESLIKAFNPTNNEDTDTQIKRTIIGNTYNWMDSHDDVHTDGIFGTSIKEKGVKAINHFHDHVNQLMAKVGSPQAIYEQAVAWTQLGINKAGNTQALFMDSLIKRSLNQSIFEQYLADEVTQHSVGMQYVKLALAINDPERKEEYAVWQRFIDKIGNKAKAEERGFFWAIYEAKLIEISCVIAGSNELTGTLPNKKDPSEDSQITEPPLSTQKSYWSIFNN